MSVHIELIQSTQTLDTGRNLSNINDLALAGAIDDLLAPAYVHVQSTPATTWTINHGLLSDNVIYQTEDSDGKIIYPATSQKTSNVQVVLTFSVAETGKCIIFVGRSDWVDPPSAELGLPTDGRWDDAGLEFNPADIQETDSIKDAIDKLNELIARIVVPPSLLQGDLEVEFPPGLQFEQAYLSEGTGQNFNLLFAGQLFANITISEGLELKPPTDPTGQFGKADKGTISFRAKGALEDLMVLDGVGKFNESLRDGNQTWQDGPAGTAANGWLKINSVGIVSNIPQYQQGDFSVFLQTYLTAGETWEMLVRHEIGSSNYDTNPLTVFFDDGPLPSVTGTPRLLEFEIDGGDYTYLDGIRYYKLNDTFSVVATIANAFKRTYTDDVVTLTMPGIVTTSYPFNFVDISPARAASLLDDTFPTGAIDTDKWTPSGTPVQANNRLEMTNPTPLSALTKRLDSNSDLIRNSSFEWSTTFGLISASSAGGWEAGLELTGFEGGKLEFVYHEDDASTTTIEAWYTPDGGARTLHASAALTLIVTDTLIFKLTNTTTDTYRFEYNKNAGGFVQLGTDLVFDELGPINTQRQKPTLKATNEVDTNEPSYSVYFDTLVVVSGKATIYTVVPDINDTLEILGTTVTLDDAEQAQSNCRIAVTPLSVRGISTTVQSAAENRLVNTYTNVSTDTKEYFFDNQYRLPIDNYLTPPASPTGNWDADNLLPLVDGNAQVFNGTLVWPSIDFTTGYLPAQQIGTDYSGFTGDQLYLRSFIPTNPQTSGTIRIAGVTLANLTANDLTVEMKIPGITGWLSLNEIFDESLFSGVDGDGCRLSNDGSDFSFTLGGFSVGPPTNTMLILRITLPDASSPAITYLETLNWIT